MLVTKGTKGVGGPQFSGLIPTIKRSVNTFRGKNQFSSHLQWLLLCSPMTSTMFCVYNLEQHHQRLRGERPKAFLLTSRLAIQSSYKDFCLVRHQHHICFHSTWIICFSLHCWWIWKDYKPLWTWPGWQWCWPPLWPTGRTASWRRGWEFWMKPDGKRYTVQRCVWPRWWLQRAPGQRKRALGSIKDVFNHTKTH